MFLKKVYQIWRPFFWLIVFFTIGQAYFMFKGIENAPFFIYSMFSTIHQDTDSLPVVLIKTPEGYYNHSKLSNREAEMLLNNADFFSTMNRIQSQDPIKTVIDRRFSGNSMGQWRIYANNQLSNNAASLARYPEWWKKYFTSVSNKKEGDIELVLSHVYFKSGYKKSPFDSVLFTINLQACQK